MRVISATRIGFCSSSLVQGLVLRDADPMTCSSMHPGAGFRAARGALTRRVSRGIAMRRVEHGTVGHVCGQWAIQSAADERRSMERRRTAVALRVLVGAV